MKSPALLLFWPLLAFAAAAQEPNGSITGVVLDSVSHRPLRKVTLTLETPPPPELPPSAEGWQVASTGDDGQFAFHGLKPGQYRLVAERADYPDWKAIAVSPSENPTPVTIELIPGAVVSGRILDEDGDPLNGCWAQARPVEHPEQIVSPQIARTAGEPSAYRLFGLRPGKYILAAECVAPAFQPRPFSTGPDPPPSRAYPLQFYPGEPDARSAEPIELAAGSERTGIDFRMRTAHVTQVRAVLATSSVDWHGTDLLVRLIRKGDSSGDDFGGMSPEASGSVYRFPKVFPGSYLLLATTLGPENRIGIERVEVKDQPVDAAIELKRAIDIHGAVELESGASSSTVQLQRIRILLLPDYLESVGEFVTFADAAVNRDGSFTLTTLAPAGWRLYVSGAPVFIRSAWLGTRAISGRTLDLSSGTADTLKIVLSANTATIRGSAPPGATVTCRDLNDKLSFQEPRVVDQSGQYRIEGLAPGRYRVAAGESPGIEITVQEGETATVDLRK